jgi:hypothetical protein
MNYELEVDNGFSIHSKTLRIINGKKVDLGETEPEHLFLHHLFLKCIGVTKCFRGISVFKKITYMLPHICACMHIVIYLNFQMTAVMQIGLHYSGILYYILMVTVNNHTKCIFYFQNNTIFSQ